MIVRELSLFIFIGVSIFFPGQYLLCRYCALTVKHKFNYSGNVYLYCYLATTLSICGTYNSCDQGVYNRSLISRVVYWYELPNTQRTIRSELFQKVSFYLLHTPRVLKYFQGQPIMKILDNESAST